MVNGLPTGVPVSPNPALAVHTLSAAVQAGEAFLDVVDLWLNNQDAANSAQVNVSFTPPGGAPITSLFIVPPATSISVFKEEPFGGVASGLGGAVLGLDLVAGVNLSTQVSSWGWFVRTGG